MNYKKNWLQFILELRILCQDSNNIFLTLKQERGLFLFLGLGNRKLFWYCDFCVGGRNGTIKNEKCIEFLETWYVNLNPVWVGGRLRKSSLNKEENHLVILSEKFAVSDIIIQYSHDSVAHGPRGMTVNNLRQRGIWVVNATVIVQHLIHKS